MSRHSNDKPAAFEPKDLWFALSEEDRRAACINFWTSEQKAVVRVRRTVLDRLAKSRQFRFKFLKNRSTDEKGRHLAALILRPTLRQYAGLVVRTWFIDTKPDFVAPFLDKASVAHQNGVIDTDVDLPDGPSWSPALDEFSADGLFHEVLVYLASLVLTGPAKLSDTVVEAYTYTFSEEIGSELREEHERDTPGQKDEEEEPESAVPQPEQSEGFTTLDHVVIRTIVACALDSDYALSEDDAEHLMDEIVGLSSDRQQSLFHRGFFHAMFSRDFEFTFPGENEQRRAWYLCGVLSGLLRAKREDESVKVIQGQRDAVKAMITNTQLPCGGMLLQHVYGPLLEAEEYGLLQDWLRHQISHQVGTWREKLLSRVFSDASALMRRGPSPGAALLLEILEELTKSKLELDESFRKSYVPLIQRKRAQALQLDGDFENATRLLEESIKELQSEDAANAIADLGLVKGGFRSLQSILPKQDEATATALRASLEAGRDHYERAIREHGKSAVNARFCLGVCDLLEEERSQSAADHLQSALEGMLKKQEAYTEGGLIDWAKFFFSIALLESLELSGLNRAIDGLRHALNSPIKFPFWLWSRALHNLPLFEATEAVEEVCAALLEKRGNEAFSMLRTIGLCTVPSLQRQFLDWLIQHPEPTVGKWDDLADLLKSLRDNQSLELGYDLLDYMESRAVEEGGFREFLIPFLTEARDILPIWDESDVATCLCRLYELDGRWLEASQTLRPAFFRLREGGEPYHVQEARQIVDRIRDYGLDKDNWKDLDCSLIGLECDTETDPGVLDKLTNGEKVTILYVGGNETQATYVEAIRASVTSKYPGVTIDFLLPGWSSNWNKDLDYVQRVLPRSDVLVLNRLVRTTLGRKIRKLCDGQHPWIGCGGRGRDAIQRRIEDAAVWEVQRKLGPHQ